MVEIWLPYGDTEIPISIPEPTTIKYIKNNEKQEIKSDDTDYLINFKKQIDMNREYLLIIDENTPKWQKINIINLFNKSKIKIKEWDATSISTIKTKKHKNQDINFEILNIKKQDIILAGYTQPNILFDYSGVKTALLQLLTDQSYTEIMQKIFSEKIYEANTVLIELEKYLDDFNIMNVNIIPNINGEIHSVYAGKGSKPFSESINAYNNIWKKNEELNELVIASAGGKPWDDTFISSLNGLFNIASKIKPKSKIIYYTEASQNLEVDLIAFIHTLKTNNFVNILLYSITKLNKLLKNKDINVTIISSSPKIYTKNLNIKRSDIINPPLEKIPLKNRREISVLENSCSIILF